ncbi:MAG: basic membrane protein A [Fusobacteria bacterium]|nr:MAG: basic membrane protein A [Fusobacteriota bacterium]KAF0229331.1 MAG: basic membrane protein [Fusobacteriota bacterium]
MKKLLWLGLVLVVFAGVALVGCNGAAKDDKFKVGVIYIGEPGDAGWTYAHDQGFKAAVKAIGEDKVELVIQQNVKEDQSATQAMEALINQGAKAIFATSFGYMDYIVDLAAKYPDVYFYHCSGYKAADNLSTYFGKIEQARYLTGMVAGSQTETNKIGYVAAMPIPEVVRGINGFTLGVRSVNPEATVKVIWTNTWYDPQVEKDAANALLKDGIDVVAQHQDTAGPQIAAQDAGKWSIGYNSDMSKFAPKATLTSAVWNWEVYYEPAIRAAMDGTFTSEQYFEGLNEGIASYSKLSADLLKDKGIQAKVDEMEAKIKGGYNIFTGPLKDNTGKVVLEAGKAHNDGELLSMMYFVEGVIGTIPK